MTECKIQSRNKVSQGDKSAYKGEELVFAEVHQYGRRYEVIVLWRKFLLY